MKTRSFTKSFGWLKPALILCSIALVATVLPAEQSVHLKAHNGQYVVAEGGGGAWTPAHVLKDPYLADTLVRAEVNAAKLADLRTLTPPPQRVFLSDLVTPLAEVQGQRNTCMAFTVAALMESAIKEETGRSVNLSEQWLHFIQKTTFLEQRALPLAENQYGRSGGSDLLWNLDRSSYYGVPVEEVWPYETPPKYEDVPWENAQAEAVDRNNLIWTMPKQVLAAPRYRTGDFVFIRGVPDPDLLRSKLELILASGRPVGIGLNISPNRFDDDHVLRPEDGEEVGGAHGVVLYGYDRDQQYFIAKNPWGNGRNPPDDDLAGLWALSYDFLDRIFAFGYIESMRDSASPTEDRALRHLGWWNLSWDGWKGNLAINRLPDQLGTGDMADEEGRRVGNLYTRSGEAYRVNGLLNPDGSHSLCLDFRDPDIDTDADVCDRFRFDLQIADDDPDWMMGTQYSHESDRTFGAYGTRGQFPRGDHAAAEPDGMRGEWEFIHGGGTARLSIDRITADGSFQGHCVVDGRTAGVRGRYDWNGEERQPGAVSFLVELPSGTRHYLGYHHSRERNVIAGRAISRPEGFVLNKISQQSGFGLDLAVGGFGIDGFGETVSGVIVTPRYEITDTEATWRLAIEVPIIRILEKLRPCPGPQCPWPCPGPRCPCPSNTCPPEYFFDPSIFEMEPAWMFAPSLELTRRSDLKLSPSFFAGVGLQYDSAHTVGLPDGEEFRISGTTSPLLTYGGALNYRTSHRTAVFLEGRAITTVTDDMEVTGSNGVTFTLEGNTMNWHVLTVGWRCWF